MPVSGEEILIRLRKQVQEKWKPFEEVVEKHLQWFDEVVIEFRRALEDKGSETSIPKSPSTKRAWDLEANKPGVETIGEDDDDPETRSPAAKKSLVENFESIPVPSSQTPPRRGRAASRVAAQKLKENIKELSNLNAKKRRPSLPESEDSAEKTFVNKKRRISSTKEVQVKGHINTRDGEEQLKFNGHASSPVDDLSKKTQELSTERSRSKEQMFVDEKMSKYWPVEVLEDTGGGECTSATKMENGDSLEVQKECKGKEDTSFVKKKSSTIMKEEPVVTPRLNEADCSPLKLDSDNEEDVMVTDAPIASEAFVPETSPEKCKNSEERSDASKENPYSVPDIVVEPSVEEGNSEIGDGNIQVPDSGVVSKETTVDRRSTASIGTPELKCKDKDAEAEARIVSTEIESQDSDKTEVEVKPEKVVRTTRTKTRNVGITTEVNEPVKMRLTRSKLRHSPQGVEVVKITEDHIAAPSFDLPGSKTEEVDEAREPSVTEQNKAEDMYPPEEPPKIRSTRTKRKESEVTNIRPIRSTRTKQKRLENKSGGSCSQDSAICTGEPSSEESESESKTQATGDHSNNLIGSTTSVEVQEIPARRMTRSKVRQLANTAPSALPSPTKSAASTTNNGSSTGDCSPCTPTKYKSPTKFEPRPFAPTKNKGTVKEMAVAYQKHIGSVREVEEMPMQEIQSASRPRINQAKVTPTFSRDKVFHTAAHRLENSSSTKSGSSGRLNSKFKPLNTSVNLGKAVSSLAGGTPTEVKRHYNILCGMPSFVTKVQPHKPSREELEEKRQEELKKKREREEETRRKKEEILKMKTEEQKRKNEERMRKVQEAREARERKALEAKEQQERERKMKVERYKEEQLRKKHLQMKKKAEEEARLQKLKEQMEEEELQRAEEQKRKEMLRVEEEKQLLIATLKKQKEEFDRKKREIEMERIGREKLELERLKQREIDRHALGKETSKVAAGANKPATSAQPKLAVLNETYTADDDKENTNLNSTYTKPNQEPSQSSQVNNSYVLTPQKKFKKKFNPANYDISDVVSGDSTDNEEKPKKAIPAWAQGAQLKNAVVNQFYYPPDVDLIFPSYLLEPPELSKIFVVKKKRFYNRTSSAVWSTPPSKLFS